MANFSPYLRSLMLRHVFTPDTISPSALDDEGNPVDLGLPLGTVYIALTTEVARVNADTSDLVEPLEGNYSRQPYMLTSGYWTDTGFGELYNTQAIYFPVVTSTWGTIKGWAMIDPFMDEVMVVGELLNHCITTIGMVPTLDAGILTLGIYG